MNWSQLLTKPVTIADGVTAHYIPHVSIRQTTTHREMISLYGGGIDDWPELALILWVCDAQTVAIDVDDSASDVWRALSQYLKVAPQPLKARMEFYQWLPAEVVQAWYTGYAQIQPQRDGDVPPKPDTADPK